MQLIQELRNVVKDELQQVDALILEHVRKANESLVSEVAEYLVNSGGKRIRPILTLLSAKLFSYQHTNAHILLAAAVEFIHAATLLHDDVIDGSEMRRAKPTANNVWGNQTSILVGDYLFSQSFKLMVETKHLAALEVLSSASSLIVEGELSQLVVLKSHDIFSVEKYMEIIAHKTATLFSAASEVGAIISKRPDAQVAIKQYGELLGMIFQIIDDVLDYDADSLNTGKNIGDDFFEGKVTLPIIVLFERLKQKDTVQYNNTKGRFFASSKSQQDLEFIIELMRKYTIFDQVQEIVTRLVVEGGNYWIVSWMLT